MKKAYKDQEYYNHMPFGQTFLVDDEMELNPNAIPINSQSAKNKLREALFH